MPRLSTAVEAGGAGERLSSESSLGVEETGDADLLRVGLRQLNAHALRVAAGAGSLGFRFRTHWLLGCCQRQVPDWRGRVRKREARPTARRSPGQCDGYFFSFSIPFVGPLPGLVAQQKAESSPHALQECFRTVSLPLPWPVTSMVELQPAQA